MENTIEKKEGEIKVKGEFTKENNLKDAQESIKNNNTNLEENQKLNETNANKPIIEDKNGEEKIEQKKDNSEIKKDSIEIQNEKDANKTEKEGEKGDTKNNLKNENKNKDKKEKEKEKVMKIPEGFSSKDQDKIDELIKTNYKKFYTKNSFCDYNIGSEWRAGFILDISDNNLKIIDATNKSQNKDEYPIVQIDANDSKKISYFRKFSQVDNYMFKGTVKNLKNKLTQFTNFHNHFKEYYENCDSYEFYYFLRATVYYGLDLSMNLNVIKNNESNENIEISFRIILIILNIACDCLKFIESYFEDYLKFENEIKNSEYKDYILISKKYAIFSAFSDINYLMRKIFGDSAQYLDWYMAYQDNIIQFIPSVNDNPNSKSICELFPLYQDQKGGDSKYKLMKKTCLEQVYKKSHIFHTLDKKIYSCIIAYFVDYFNYIGGYDTLFNLLCSIYHDKDNYETNFNIQNNIIDDLFTSKIITGSFYRYIGVGKIKSYIDKYVEIIEDGESLPFYQDELGKLFLNMIDLIQRNEEEKSLLGERNALIYLFRNLTKTKKLEKNISLITNLNNIIKSVQYNNLYKEIKEKKNREVSEEMLTDKQFQGRDEKIKIITEEYFCTICQENKIIELFMENQATHEEIIKRSFPLLFIMYKHNFGYSKNEKKIDINYVFEKLFIKLKESELNNESLWKIILNDIILEFSEKLNLKDKNYVFELIKKYYNETTTKKNSKIIQLLSFIINYSLRCIRSNAKNQKEKDLINDESKETNKDEYDRIIKGTINEKKYYCLEILINHLINKEKINELEINEELKISSINTCIDGIIDILNENKKNDELIKIICVKIIEAIISSINVIHNINLLTKIFNIDEKNKIKEKIEKYCKEKNVMKRIFEELLNYLKNPNIPDEKINKLEMGKRLDLIFLLSEINIEIKKEHFKYLFLEINKLNDSTKKVFFSKIKENILKIDEKLRDYIFKDILLNKETNFEINDFTNYQLLKDFIIQINNSKEKFIYINEKDILVLSKDFCKDIYGYESLWNILMKTTNKQIKNDVANFLAQIFLGIRYRTGEEYKKFWNNIIKKIVDNLNLYKKNKLNNNAIKGLIMLIKKINDVSNNDGDIVIVKDIVDKILEPLTSKVKENDEENKDLKTESRKSSKKEGKKEELNKEKNEEIPIKILLEYYEIKDDEISSSNMFDFMAKADNKIRRTKICKIYKEEFIYQLRYFISYEFRIPLKCISIQKAVNQNPSDKKKNTSPSAKNPKFNLLYDCFNVIELFPELNKKRNKKELEEYLPVYTVEYMKNPLNSKTSDNLKNLIYKNEELIKILKDLSKNKNNDYGLEIYEIINDKKEVNKEKEQEINKIIEDLLINNDKKKENEKEELINKLFNFEDSNKFYMNYVLSHIFNYIKNFKPSSIKTQTPKSSNDNSKKIIINKFINSSIWQNKIKNLSVEDNTNNKYSSVNELFESIKYVNNLFNIYKIIIDNSDENIIIDFISAKIFEIYYNIIYSCINIDLQSLNKQNKEDKDNIIKIQNIYENVISEVKELFSNNKNFLISFIRIIASPTPKDENIKEKFEFCFIDGSIANRNQLLTEKILNILSTLIKSEFIKTQNDILKKFYYFICSIFYTKNSHEKIIYLLSELSYNSNILIVLNNRKYEYNLKLYLNTIAEILTIVYQYICDEFNFDNYINESILPLIYEPILKGVKKESNYNESFFGGNCLILANYILNIDYEKYKSIINYKGKDLKEYLFNDIIMYNCDKELVSSNQMSSINDNKIKITNSLKEAHQLFIIMIIKELNNPQENINNNKNASYYINKLNNYNKFEYRNKENESQNQNGYNSEWKLYFKDEGESNTNTFIGLRNLGCTCYMNSLLQVFYNIELFRESLLGCDFKEENNNSLFETQKLFLNLKHLKKGYYTPNSFVENFDNEKLNVHQQMDVDEFFSNIIDKLENRLKNTGNDNLLKYFFQGRFNDTLTFQEGCSHHRTNINDFYSIQLQVQNKKNVYESLDTLTEGELMNGDNCIFCPECNKKYPAIKRQCFRTLPRILLFVLKRFEFNFDTMTKFKVHDYYEFPIELDMNKYTSDFIDNKNTSQNNKYALKSVVVHMGSSEGGHYYAFIKDKKSKTWYQFNDTSVTEFNIKNLAKEAFGGKEEDSKTQKNRSAYLLFYEKIDQSNCEIFDKNKSLNKLLNINEEEIKTKNDENNKEEEFSLFTENKNEEKEEKEEKNNIIENKVNEEKTSEMSEFIKNINQQMFLENLKQKLFSNEYHHFTLELYINLLNRIDYNNNNLLAYFDSLCYIYNDTPFQSQLSLLRTERNKGSNLSKYINKGKLKIVEMNNNNQYSQKEKEEKIIELFGYILIDFFNVVIRSRERKYLGCYVNLIIFLINRYEFCANYFLEEISCYNTIVEYLINCPVYEIKKIIVGIIYSAMIKSHQDYLFKKKQNKETSNITIGNTNYSPATTEVSQLKCTSENEKNKEKSIEISKGNLEKEKNENKENDKINKQENRDDKNSNGSVILENEVTKTEQADPGSSQFKEEKSTVRNNNNTQTDEELAKKLQEQYNNEINYNKKNKKEDKEGDIKLLENKDISPNVLKLIYNVYHTLYKIKYSKYEKEARFLFAILLKFSFISSEAKNFMIKNLKLNTIININHFENCAQKHYTEDISDLEKGIFKTSHEILNPSPNKTILGENDKEGNNYLVNYDFLLLCSLIYCKEKAKNEMEKRKEDLGYSFYNGEYIFRLIKQARTKEDINYLSNVIRLKCKDNKEILDIVLEQLISILDRISDKEEGYFDESDEEKNNNIYKNKNYNPNSKTNILILLRSNITIIFKKLILESKDKLDDYKVNSCLSKLFSFFSKNKKFYGKSIPTINIIMDILEERNYISKYSKEFKEISNWLNKFKIPPKYYEIRGIYMYCDDNSSCIYYYQREITKDFKKEFEQVETEKAKKKIERANKILEGKSNFEINKMNSDLSDFKFMLGDKVIYDNKIYEVTNYLDELIKIKLIENDKDRKNNEMKVKDFNKNKTIYEKEKTSFWIETNDYRLKIKSLIN